MNLVYIRKVGYGVRKAEDLFGPDCTFGTPAVQTQAPEPVGSAAKPHPGCEQELNLLKNLLDQVLENR